jgi:hypothetical protein
MLARQGGTSLAELVQAGSTAAVGTPTAFYPILRGDSKERTCFGRVASIWVSMPGGLDW